MKALLIALLGLVLFAGSVQAGMPAVYAGADQSVTLPAHGVFHTDSLSTNTASTAWTSSNSGVSFGSATSKPTTVNVPAIAGTYMIVLTGVSNTTSTLRTSDTAIITVVAEVTPTPTPTATPFAGSEITVSATAGSCSLYRLGISPSYPSYLLSLTANSSGAVTVPKIELAGRILGITFAPGSTTPTDAYDLTLLDPDGLDAFRGLGANLSKWGPQHFVPLDGNGTTTNTAVAVSGRYTLSAINMGSSGTSTIRIILEQRGR